MRSIFSALSRSRGRARTSLAVEERSARPPPRDVSALRGEILALGLTADRALELANALEREGRLLEAFEALTQANRLRRDFAVERRLVRLQRDAFAQLDRSLPPPAWPPFVPDDAQGTSTGPLMVTPAELTPGVLRNGIMRHGCVLVRGLVAPERAVRLREGVDRAFDACDATRAGRATPEAATWFDPLEDVPDGDDLRRFGRAGQGILAADSPRVLYEFLETVRDVQLDRLIAAYLGERPTLSVQKVVLRRVDWTLQHALWHQDGAFLGEGIRTVNAWFALSPCGRNAPGMDLIPGRIERLITAGEAGAGYDWTVSPDTITRELPGVPPWRPEFDVGDVLLFDHLMLHRTAAAPGMTDRRYAIESWFFASSVYPNTSTPLVV
jgi:Phytanoyl-CoA dioxygenase (PhyH)